MFVEGGDTVLWSLCCFPKGIPPPTHPAIHPTIQLTNLSRYRFLQGSLKNHTSGLQFTQV